MTADERKARPVYSGVLRYFPLALMEVARVSAVGHEQHNDGPMRWDRTKSPDEADALVRHLLQAGEIDSDGLRHTAKAAWRALALLEKELEAASLACGDKPANLRIRDSGTPNVPERDDRAPAPPDQGRIIPSGTRTSVQDSGTFTNNERPAHDELYALAQPCAGGCGKVRYPPGTCRKCARPTAPARSSQQAR